MISHSIKTIFLSVKKNRLFHSINLVGFITGFLVLTVIFTFVYQELSFDKFHSKAENIYRIHCGGYGVTPPCFAEKLKNKIPEINGIIRFRSTDLTLLTKNNEVHIDNTYYTDPEIFNIFSFKLLSGNVKEALIAPFSMVINITTANKIFGIDFPIGEIIQNKDGTVYTITGVMEDIPYTSHIQANAFISIETLRSNGNENEFNCGSWSILTYLSLSNNENCREVEEKINIILDDFKMETDEGKFHLELQPLNKVYFDSENNKFDGSKHGSFLNIIIYFAISVLIFLIVILNYINLSTLISAERIKEIAIIKINGATRIQIIKLSLLESFGMALVSFIVAILAIEFLLPQLCNVLNISMVQSLSRWILYLYYFIGIVTVGLIIGLIPGIILSKTIEIKALNNESFLNTRGFQRKILLVIQLFIVSVFLNATFITKNQINYIFEKDLGFNYENVVSFNLDKILTHKKEILKTNLSTKSDIEHVSFSDGLIGAGFAKAPINYKDKSKICSLFAVDPDYIDLYNMNIKDGINFSWNLASDFKNSCIVNEQACSVFELRNPIGKKLNNRTIIGVVRDFNYTTLHNQIDPLIITCSNEGKIAQVKISSKNKSEVMNIIELECKKISPDYKCNFTVLNTSIKELYKSELDLENSFELYSIITFIIALLGLLGLFLFTIKKKTKEISIRLLFGAKLWDTFKLLTKEQIWIVTVSNILAIPFTYIVMNIWLNYFQYRAEIGLVIFFKTYFVTVLFILLTIIFLIIKTHRLDLIKSLKHE